jgi:predicted transcriptional regulator of viral defense system
MEAKYMKILAQSSPEYTITMDDLVDNFGHTYYGNARFHLSQMMSRMVKKGEFVRIKKGVYMLNFAPIVKGEHIIVDLKQGSLF